MTIYGNNFLVVHDILKIEQREIRKGFLFLMTDLYFISQGKYEYDNLLSTLSAQKKQQNLFTMYSSV